MNSHSEYQPDNYGQGVVKRKVDYTLDYITQGLGQLSEHFISQNIIQSEQNIFGLGISSEEYNFYQINKGSSTTQKNGYNSYFYKWNSETIENQRAIYTFWDFLGDVGGLFDMLKLLGQVFIAIMTAI